MANRGQVRAPGKVAEPTQFAASVPADKPSRPEVPGLPVVEEAAPETAVKPFVRTSNAVNAIIHMYRAEVGRLVSYRQRLDITTNWAITSSALAASFGFGSNYQLAHAPFLFLMFLNCFFLQLEANRFKLYEGSRHRVLLLEQLLMPEMLGEQIEESWHRRLVMALREPPPSVSLLGAMGWRLRRTYLAIYSALVLAWVLKLASMDSGPQSLDAVVGRAALGPLPGIAVVVGVVLLFGALVLFAITAERNYPYGNEQIRELMPGMAD